MEADNVDGNQSGEVLVAINIRKLMSGVGIKLRLARWSSPPTRESSAKFLSLSSFRNELGTGLELLT